MATLIAGRETGYGTSKRGCAGWCKLGGYGTRSWILMWRVGDSCDTQESRSLCPEREIFAVGRSWGSVFVRMGPGKALDIFRKISARSMVPLAETFFPCTSRTYSQFNARLGDPNRKSSRRARANRHVGGTRTSTLGPSGIEPPLKRKIPVTRDDTDEFMLWGSPGCVSFRGGTTLVVAFYYPQTVSIAYCGSRIVVTNV